MAACLPSHRNAWNVHAPWCWVSSWCGRPCLMPCLLHTRPVAITCRGRAAASSRTGYEPLVGSHAPPCCAWVLLVVLMMKPSSGDPAQCSVPPACLMKALLVAATLCWASAVCSLQSVGVFFWSISISRRPRIVHVHMQECQCMLAVKSCTALPIQQAHTLGGFFSNACFKGSDGAKKLS